MNIMLIHGLRVVRAGDNVYMVSDSRREIGGVVRALVAETEGSPALSKKFCGPCGQWHMRDTLGEAVADFIGIAGVTPFDDKGDIV